MEKNDPNSAQEASGSPEDSSPLQTGSRDPVSRPGLNPQFQVQLSPRKQLRAILADLRPIQEIFALNDPLPPEAIERGFHGLAQIEGRLKHLATQGLYPGRLPRWLAALETLRRMREDSASAKTILRALSNLRHEIAERAEVSTKEESFVVLSQDRETPVGESFPCDLVLDNLRSAFNTGSILRSADGFGVREIYLSGITPGLENPKVKKTALGAEKNSHLTRVDSLHALIKEKQGAGCRVYAFETAKGARELTRVKLEFPACLILGNEEYGIPEDYLAVVDEVIRIPLHGIKNSLNVASSAAIVIYEARRQWEAGKASS